MEEVYGVRGARYGYEVQSDPVPELPEVEAVRRELEPRLSGARIVGVLLRRPDLRRPFPTDFERRLRGATVHRLARRGKYLLADLSSGETLVMHLGMSGAFRVHDADAAPEPHDHVVLALESGVRVSFNDPRRFGIMDLVPSTDLDRRPPLAAMGLEPLSAEFNGAALARACARRRTPIKVALLDQEVVAGLGQHLRERGPQPGAPLAATAGIEHRDSAGRPRKSAHALAAAIKAVLHPGDRTADWPTLPRRHVQGVRA